MTIEALEQRTLFSIDTIGINNVLATARPDLSVLSIDHGFPRVFASVNGFAISFGSGENAVIRLANGTLKIVGTNFGDAITVNQSFSNQGNVLSININGVVRTINADLVNRIVISGRGGGDVIDIADGLSVPVRVLGGSGNDLIFGNLENDSIFGGTGNDIITGGGGVDILRGQLGTDLALTSNAAIAPPLFNLTSMLGNGFASGLRLFSGPLDFGAVGFSNQPITTDQLIGTNNTSLLSPL